MKTKAAHSLDWWRPTELRRLPWTAFAMLANLFNVAEEVGHLPRALQRGMIAAIAKDSSTVTPLQVRPICLLPVLHRIWSSCRYHDMSDWADAVTSPAQAAYKRGRSARGEVVKLIEHINTRCARGAGGYLGQLDLSKAFPRLCHNKVTSILLRMGAPPWLTSMLQDACLKKSLAWKINGRLSEFVPQTRGTPQGCALSVLLFQLSLSPVVAEIEAKIQADRADARVLFYADDVVIFASTLPYLQELLALCSTLMTQMGMLVNESKSSVTPILCDMPFVPHLNGIPLPVRLHPDILGCSLIQASAKLPIPSALTKHTDLRSLRRRHKVLERLERLRGLALHTEAKDALWRQMVLPILTFDPWVVIPSNQSARAWRAHITGAIYSNIAGKKHSAVASSLNGCPHQTDLWSLLVHECLRIAYDDICDLPATELMQAPQPVRFYTPTTALVALLKMKQFSLLPEGIVSGAGHVLTWPPSSKGACLHEMREIMRDLVSNEFLAPGPAGGRFDRLRAAPASDLSQTQKNFWRTLQLGAHKGLFGGPCTLCNEQVTMDHILWYCEGRRLHTALAAPANHADWPSHFRLSGLLLTTDDLDASDIYEAQHYMTTTLIERRADEQVVTGKLRTEADLDEQLDRTTNIATMRTESDHHPDADHFRSASRSDFGGRAASSTDCMPCLDPPQIGTTSCDAASTAAGPAAPNAVFGPPEIYCIAVSDDEAPTDLQAPLTKRRRTSWKNVQVPQHITRCQDLLEEKFECTRCGARATVQYRVKFVQAHANCEGIADKVAKGAIAAASRVHVRRKRVHAHLELEPNDSRHLSSDWLLEHGKLPLNVSQLEDFGPLTCLLCGSTAASAARKTFVPKQVKCLQSITTYDLATGTVRIDLDTLRNEAHRSAAGLPPLCAKKRRTLS
eukprot:4495797-Amphidinium_carterae.5